MSKPEPIPSFLKRNDLAKLFDVVPATIDSYIARGILPEANGSFDTRECIQKSLNYFRALAARRTTEDDDALKSARIEETVAKTRRTELEIAEKERQLVAIDDVQQMYASTLREIAIWIDSIPDSFERQGILDKRGVDKARDQCDQQRRNIYVKLERQLEQLQTEVDAEQPDDGQAPDVVSNREPEAADQGKRKRGRPRKVDNSNPDRGK